MSYQLIKLIESKHIDKEKWDKAISNSPIENIFMYSWYLDATADYWSGLITDDYSTVFPITYTNKLGVKQFYQAFFTRQFEVIGNGFTLTQAIEFIKKDFKFINFRSSQALELKQTTTVRQHQVIDLKSEIKLSTNAKRLIKKSNKNFTYKYINDISPLINLIKTTLTQKIKEFTPENVKKLEQLMLSALKNNKGECIGIFENDTFVGAGFFFNDKNTITYLKGTSTDESKKNGAMYGLINYAIHLYQPHYSTFDFGGSTIENVAVFYKKFGADDKNYKEYTINHLPLWFNTIKKLKK